MDINTNNRKHFLTEKDVVTSRQPGMRFLDIFYPCSLMYNWVVFHTVMHFYYGAKTQDKKIFYKILSTWNVEEVLKISKNIPDPDDWDNRKIKVMQQGLELKFGPGWMQEELVKLHGKEIVIFGHPFWGVAEDGVGANVAGQIIAKICDEIVIERAASRTAELELLAESITPNICVFYDSKAKYTPAIKVK